MRTPEFTTLVALDLPHLEEFKIVWPTWVRWRSEIVNSPIRFIVDERSGSKVDWWSEHVKWWSEQLQAVTGRGDFTFTFTGQPLDRPQRERMLSALVFRAGEVTTPYYLKLDVDCVATGPDHLPPELFEGNPAFIAPSWGYSKPADVIDRLDNWGDSVAGVKEFPRLDISFDPAGKRVVHPRMISYAMFGNTEWTKRMSELAGGRLPVPSQDTFLWYCAARRRDMFRTVKKWHGWRHVRRSRLREACAEALAGTGTG